MVVPKPKATTALPPVADDKPKATRISWAKLLKRVFGIDVETCTQCQGKMKILSAIEDPKIIKKILTHLGLPSVAPTPWPPRGPPEIAGELNQQNHNFADI